MKNLKYTLLFLFAFSQVACTTDLPTEGSSNSSSRIDSEVVDTENGSDGNLYLECSPFYQSNLSLRGQFLVFRRPSTGQVINDYMTLALSQWPSELSGTDTHYLQAFRITGDNGFRELNGQATDMFFMNRTNGQILNESVPVNNISRSVIDNMISQYNLAAGGITRDNFLSVYLPVLKNVDLIYDAVALALYDSAQGTQSIGSFDVLLPAFSADPNDYANTHIAYLDALHPLYDRRGGGLTESQFQSEGLNLCRQHL